MALNIVWKRPCVWTIALEGPARPKVAAYIKNILPIMTKKLALIPQINCLLVYPTSISYQIKNASMTTPITNVESTVKSIQLYPWFQVQYLEIDMNTAIIRGIRQLKPMANRNEWSSWLSVELLCIQCDIAIKNTHDIIRNIPRTNFLVNLS